MRHRLGHRGRPHRRHERVHVGNIHEHRHPRGVLRVDKCPNIGDAEGAEDLFALRRGKLMLLILHVVVADHGGHAVSSMGVPSGSAGRCADPTPADPQTAKARQVGRVANAPHQPRVSARHPLGMQPSQRSLGPGQASLEGYVSIEQMSGSELGCPAPHPRPWPVAVTSAKLLLHEVQGGQAHWWGDGAARGGAG